MVLFWWWMDNFHQGGEVCIVCLGNNVSMKIWHCKTLSLGEIAFPS
jgi:hypothetical protein